RPVLAPDRPGPGPPRGTPRPGGLALWWDVSDHSVPWAAGQSARLRRHLGTGDSADGTPGGSGSSSLSYLAEDGFARRPLPWCRTVPVDTHLAGIAGHRAFLVPGPAGEEATRRFLDTERGHLAPVFPDGMAEERDVAELAELVELAVLVRRCRGPCRTRRIP
ncbi:MAG TPA: hypothetical protein VN520_27815, partial [Streptomyces sp.]|nr:hypothetical protein [Streptomyces sp.]